MTAAPMSDDPVIVRVEGGWGRLTLNRPRALHALTTQMCEQMTRPLMGWREDAAIQAVMIDHAGERGFCAGGDIRMLAKSGAGDGAQARAFFAAEYRLNALLFDYPKPVVAVMDGVVMGGGVGLSAPAQYRIATPRTVFAMPETGIGLFPDVGGGWFLPRLAGQAGLWLALTGARIGAADCLMLGLATEHVDVDRLDALKAALLARPEAIAEVLTQFESEAGEPPLARVRDQLDRAFCGDSVEAIVAALQAEGTNWARAQLQALASKSPQTLKVALRELRQGAAQSRFADEMAVEYRIACRVIHRHDFQEGVRAVIIDKDNAPAWDPPTLAEVGDTLVDAIFAPLPADEEWTPL